MMRTLALDSGNINIIRRSFELLIRVSKGPAFFPSDNSEQTVAIIQRNARTTKMNSVQKDFRVYRLALWSAYRQSDVSLSHFDSVLLRPHIDILRLFFSFLRFFDPPAFISVCPPSFSFFRSSFQPLSVSPPPGPIFSLAWNIPKDERKDPVINCRSTPTKRDAHRRDKVRKRFTFLTLSREKSRNG